MVVVYYNTKLVSPNLKNKIKQIVNKYNIRCSLLNYHNNDCQVKLLKIITTMTIKLRYYNVT